MQFLSPWFLLGALVVGIPLWLHLIRHEQAIHVPFSSLMFLRRIPVKSVSRQRLKYLLLLATRILVILLITLAFARPYFPAAAPLFTAGGNGKQVVILLDVSMSMQYGDRWQRAVEAARQVIAALGEQDQAQIATFASNFQIQNLPSSDKAALETILNGLTPTASPTSYAQAIRAADRIAEDAERPLSVVLISDLQKAGLDQSMESLAFSSVREFRIEDVAEGEAPNWAVESVRSRPMVFQSRYPERLVVQLRGYGAPETSKEVVLSLGDRVVEKKSLKIQASGRATVVFEGFDVPLGSNRGMIRMAPADSLSLDDSYHFTLERREPYRILFLRESSEQAELYYFRNALAAETDSPFAMDARTPAEAASLRLSDYSMVICSNIGYLPPLLLSNLEGFVKDGGGVLFTMGNRVPFPSPESQWHDLWPGKSVGKKFLTSDAERLLLLGEFDREHPLFREFRETGADSLRAVEVYAYAQIQPEGTVLLSFSNGDPALVEKRFGQGRILWFASSFDNVWSDFPLHPAFVPLVHQLAQYGTQLPSQPPAYTIPTAISLASLRPDAETAGISRIWDIFGPDGKREVPLAEEQRPDFLTVRQPGFYEIRQRGTSQAVAANPDPQESDLTQLSPEDRTLWAAGGKGASHEAGATVSGELANRQTIWWNLLLIALALAAVEVYLANQYLKPGKIPIGLQKTAPEGSHVS
ncbi:MAG: BatA domain-containing protein [Acidobacteria bacterium]|nr:BatA domain-containing protein [Acidobacteriota bacterium]